MKINRHVGLCGRFWASEVLKIDGTTNEQWNVQCDGILPTDRKKVFFTPVPLQL